VFFSLRSHYYSFEWAHTRQQWPHPEAVVVGALLRANALPLHSLRLIRNWDTERIVREINPMLIEDAGWHMSFFGGQEKVL
jgi:hypothetical protein